MPTVLERITIYPIKSLDGVSVAAAEVLPNGALANDRRFALFDADGRVVNGKRTPAVQRIRAESDVKQWTVCLDDRATFSLLDERDELGEWLSAALGLRCELRENRHGGFPDDTAAPGPTVIGTATLETVSTWFTGLALDETRRRFRANLEISGVEPFWEDCLVGAAGVEVPFAVGDVEWLGVNPCQRCVVPSRDSHSGEVTPAFQKSFATERRRLLPEWAPRDRFDHFYRLAVNTRLSAGRSSNAIRVGDVLRLMSR